MSNSSQVPPSQPRNGNGPKVSQRGLFSIAMLLLSIGGLGFAMLGGTKMVFDLLGENPNPVSLVTQAVVVGLAYAVGWATAILAIRVYGNLILPILINWFTWGCLAAVCYLYVEILKRMYAQPDDMGRFIKYLVVMAGGLGALLGLHLINEDHDLRTFSIPLLLLNLTHLGLIVFRYVFDTAGVKPSFLWKDVVFFVYMTSASLAMLTHLGVLDPLRKWITVYFDRNSTSIRSKD
jgi:hypothetical protein